MVRGWSQAPWLGALSLWLTLSGCVSWDPDFDGDGELPRAFGGNDCDNHDAAIPGVEVCGDGLDNDCNGDIDEPEAVDASLWFIDRDLDGFGDRAAEPVPSCTAPEGFVADHTDCDDLVPGVHPGVDDVCDAVDQDCDGNVDEDAETFLWYADADADGFGAPGTPVVACAAPDGYADNDEDCDDTAEVSNPRGAELCDDEDNDCDGDIDEGLAKTTWHPDADGDGFGDPDAAVIVSCPRPEDYTADATDCDDTELAVNPDAAEVWYDGVDQDCDAGSDYDRDLDGFDSDIETVKDKLPAGDDCDDGDARVNPDAGETWYDGVDQDCDEASDYDQDGDGYEAKKYGGTDCDDTAAKVNPGATEVYYDGTDQDCDGKSDYDRDRDGYDSDDYGGTDCLDTDATAYRGATEVWYNGVDNDCDGSSVTDDYDQDGDGYTSEKYTVGDASDCDDTDDEVSPGLTDTVADGKDQDCDDVDSCYRDADKDGYGSTTIVDGKDLSCDTADKEADDDDDCDDASADDHPGATEVVANGDDDDCDTYELCYSDGDGDGYGTTTTRSSPNLSCADSGESSLATDCDDSAILTYPGAPETVADGIDQDCDTVDSCYRDADKDGYGSTTIIDGVDLSCGTSDGEADDDDDCDDTRAVSYPGATELYDGRDNNCDGYGTGESDYDQDRDGYVNSTESDADSVTLSTLYRTDCDDADATIHPMAWDVYDGSVDEDCDGNADKMHLDYAVPSTPARSPLRGVTKISAASSNGLVALGATDLDVDGSLDLVAGVWLEDVASGTSTLTDAGAVYFGYGDTALFSGGTVLAGAAVNDQAGRAIALPGDVNADGKGSDLLVGIPGYDGTFPNSGGVCLVPASASLTSGLLKTGATGVCSFVWVGSANGEGAGRTLASLGTFNLDSYPDFAVGAPGASPSSRSGAGRVYLVLGGSGAGSSALSSAWVTVNGGAAGDGLGTALTGVADWDEGGRREVAIGAPGYDSGGSSDVGAVYLYQTSSGAAPGTASYTLTGAAAGDKFGSALASGDVDGDGFGDLVVGAPGVDQSSTTTDVGAVYLFISSPAGSAGLSTADATWLGAAKDDALGMSVDVVGNIDADADGYEDIVIGAPGVDYKTGGGTLYSSAGAAYVVFGGKSWSSTAKSITTVGTTLYYTSGDHAVGTMVSRAGDFDDDGYDDFLVGRSAESFYLWNGRD